MNSSLRIGLLTSGDASSRSLLSGTPYFIGRTLAQHCGEVVYLGPVPTPPPRPVRRVMSLARRVLPKQWPRHHRRSQARMYAQAFRRKMPPDLDVLVAPFGSTEIACLETKVPIVYVSDTTFRLIHGYYPEFSDMAERHVEEGDSIEVDALARADLVLYPSEWAASSARADYGVEDARIRVLPFGANLDCIPPAKSIAGAKPGRRCSVLFLGVDWDRKGGAIAFETVRLLREAGVDAHLTVCGCVPPARYKAPWMRRLSRLDKDIPEEQRRLSALLLEASVLLLPTRKECYGLVFAEASAHGTPVVATDTGGVGGAVRSGVNGWLLPEDAGADAYARKIAELHGDARAYAALVRSSRREYDRRLSWDIWGKRVRTLVEGLVSRA